MVKFTTDSIDEELIKWDTWVDVAIELQSKEQVE